MGEAVCLFRSLRHRRRPTPQPDRGLRARELVAPPRVGPVGEEARASKKEEKEEKEQGKQLLRTDGLTDLFREESGSAAMDDIRLEPTHGVLIPGWHSVPSDVRK